MDSQAAETLTFSCPACDTSLRVPSSLAGVRGPCPQCGVEISAPQPPEKTGQPPRRSTSIPGPKPVEEPRGQASHEDNLLSSEQAGALPPPRQSIPSHLPQGEPEQSIIRSPASRENLPGHAPRNSPGDEPITNGIPLPSRQLHAHTRQKQHPVNRPPSKKTVKRRVTLHPLSLILIMLLSAGSGAVAMLIIDRMNESPLTLPSLPFLNFDAGRENPDRMAAARQGVPTTRESRPAKPVTPPAPTPSYSAQDDPGAANPVTTHPAPAPKPQMQLPAPETGVDAARKVLDTFLAAASVAERIKYVQTPDFVASKMEIYYGKYPLKLNVTNVKHEVSSPVPQSNRQFHIFQLTTPQHPSGFPVSVEETQHGCLVDWISFVQFHDNLLGKFIRIYQPQPDTFHAILERAHYFRSDVPDLGSKFCFRIKPPVPGYEGHAFVNHGSPLADRIEQKFKWDKIYFPVLELQWTRTPDGARYIEIKDVVQDNWRAIQ